MNGFEVDDIGIEGMHHSAQPVPINKNVENQDNNDIAEEGMHHTGKPGPINEIPPKNVLGQENGNSSNLVNQANSNTYEWICNKHLTPQPKCEHGSFIYGTYKMGKLGKILITVFIFICLLTFTIIDAIKAEYFLLDSAAFTTRIQNHMSKSLADVIFKVLFSEILTYWIMPYLVFHFHWSQNKPRTLTMFLFWSLTMYCGGFTKISYWDSRPYYAYLDCEAWHCSCDNGKPSGHSIMAVMNSTLLIHEIYYQMINNTIAKKVKWWFWLLAF